MSNINKSFKNKAKRGLCMAAGGVTPGFLSSVEPMQMSRAPGMADFSTPSPMRQGQSMAPAGAGMGGGGPGLPPPGGQPVAHSGIQRQLGDQIALGAAHSALSNTEKYQLANPNNDRYGASGPAPGSSAAASQEDRSLGIQKQLMTNLQSQSGMGMAAGGVAETADQLMARMAKQYGGATSAAAAPAPAPAPAAAPAPAPVAAPAQPNILQSIRNRNAQLKEAAAMANGGVANPSMTAVTANRPNPAPEMARAALNGAGQVVDSLPYAAAQFVPGLSLPLGAAAAAVHTAQGRYEDLPLDAASMLPGGKSVHLAKGAKLAAARTIGQIGRGANALQTLGAADAFGSPALANGGVAQGIGDDHMVHGPGPVGKDSVPATLAPGEGVIPAKMVNDYFGGPAKLEQLIESQTGEPTATRHGLRGGLHAAAGTGGAYPDGLTPRPEGEGLFGGRSVKQVMYDVAASPERKAIDSGTATPAQVSTEQQSAGRLRDSDTPFDVAGPMAPVGVAVRGLSKAPGMIDKAIGMAGEAGSAVKGMFTRAPKAAAQSAEAAAPLAAATAGDTPQVLRAAAAPDRTRAAADTADYMASREAQDAKFAAAKSAADAGAEAAVTGEASKAPLVRSLGSAAYTSAPMGSAFAATDPVRAAHDKIMAGGAGNPLAPITPEQKASLVADRKARETTAAISAGSAPDPRFTASKDQTRGLRSGSISNQADDKSIQRGTSTVDATEMQAPNGGGYITNKSGKAMFVAGQDAPARDPNKTYDVNGNDMTRTNGMRAQLEQMQKDRFLGDATATNRAYREGGKTGLAAMQLQDQTALGRGKLAVEDKLAQGQLAHYKQLEAQYGQQRAMAIYQVQRDKWDRDAKGNAEFIDGQYGPAIDPKNGKTEETATRQSFDRSLQYVMAQAGITHPGQISRDQLLNLQKMHKLNRDADANNEGFNKWIEFAKGNRPRTSDNPAEWGMGEVRPGVTGGRVTRGLDSTTHNVNTLVNDGLFGVGDADAERLLYRPK